MFVLFRSGLFLNAECMRNGNTLASAPVSVLQLTGFSLSRKLAHQLRFLPVQSSSASFLDTVPMWSSSTFSETVWTDDGEMWSATACCPAPSEVLSLICVAMCTFTTAHFRKVVSFSKSIIQNKLASVLAKFEEYCLPKRLLYMSVTPVFGSTLKQFASPSLPVLLLLLLAYRSDVDYWLTTLLLDWLHSHWWIASEHL